MMAEEVAPKLAKYERIFLLLDNDPAGEQATKRLMQAHPKSADSRRILGVHKDLNEWLQATTTKPLTP